MYNLYTSIYLRCNILQWTHVAKSAGVGLWRSPGSIQAGRLHLRRHLPLSCGKAAPTSKPFVSCQFPYYSFFPFLSLSFFSGIFPFWNLLYVNFCEYQKRSPRVQEPRPCVLWHACSWCPWVVHIDHNWCLSLGCYNVGKGWLWICFWILTCFAGATWRKRCSNFGMHMMTHIITTRTRKYDRNWHWSKLLPWLLQLVYLHWNEMGRIVCLYVRICAPFWRERATGKLKGHKLHLIDGSR